jgi:hypothetical protein
VRWLRRSLVGLLVVVVFVLIGVAFSLPKRTEVVSDAAVPAVTDTTPAVPAPSASPEPVPSASSAPPVAPAIPTQLSFTANGVTVTDRLGIIRPKQHADGSWDAVDPPQLGPAYWWQGGLSHMPGIPSAGTVYIYGHSCGPKSKARAQGVHCAFDELMLLAPHDFVKITTPNGVLTYEVSQKQQINKPSLSTSALVYHDAPNRLVLITCAHAGDSPDGATGNNWFVDAWLVSGIPN